MAQLPIKEICFHRTTYISIYKILPSLHSWNTYLYQNLYSMELFSLNYNKRWKYILSDICSNWNRIKPKFCTQLQNMRVLANFCFNLMNRRIEFFFPKLKKKFFLNYQLSDPNKIWCKVACYCPRTDCQVSILYIE